MQGVSDTFDRTYQANSASVGRVRADIADFAAAHGASRSRIDDIRLAVSEAVTNAVVHGYRETSGTVHLSATHVDGALWISIRDFGCGMRSRPIGTGHTGMGLGLALIDRVVTDVQLSVAPQGGVGTDVRMRFDLVSADAPTELHLTVA